MSGKDADALVLQGRGLRALGFATMPIAFADTALWIGIQALRGADPLQGFGNAATVGLVLMVVIGWACHFAASRHQMVAGGMPRVLYVIFGLIVVAAVASLVVPIFAASLPCAGLACTSKGGTAVTMAIVLGAIAALASVNTIRLILSPPLLRG